MMESVEAKYLTWYYIEQPKLILKAWKNLLKFNLNYFSIILLLKTLFSPWRRYQMSYGRGFDIKRYFEAFTFNMVSRFIGAGVRIVLIIIGLVVEIIIFFGGLILLFGWLISPFLLFLSLAFGIKFLIL